MKWQIKFIKNALFGILPFNYKLRQLKRTFVPYSESIDENFLYTLDQALKSIVMLKNANFKLQNKTVLELGSGWRPIFPIIYKLAGCNKVITLDQERLMDYVTIRSTVNNLKTFYSKIASGLGRSEEYILNELNIDDCKDLESILNKFNINYEAPSNIFNCDISNESIDLFVTRAVLEHINPILIEKLLLLMHRILSSNGHMMHIIDNSDHWEHNDKTICRINFLKYSEPVSSLLSFFNKQDYQNRLRHSDYNKMFIRCGYVISAEVAEIDDKIKQILIKSKNDLAKSFRNYSNDDIATLTSYIIAVKDNSIKCAA